MSLSYGQLKLTGSASGLNMFTVTGAQLTQAQGVVITLSQPGATALVNVTTDTDLTLAEQYMNLTGVTAAGVAWNLPLATTITLTGSVDWQGLMLAPNAELDARPNGQLHGQLIADTIPAENLASARRHLFPFAHATAVDAARAARAATRVVVLGPLVACPAVARSTARPRPPTARATC